jgi:tetratricopeptide (TPR) repeat protein
MNRFDLGAHARLISTTSAEAQRWFNLGLNWCYGFNKGEGVKCFQKALEYDPECVLAHWGVAFGAGPFYNLIWREHGESEADASAKLANKHLAQARSLSHRATDVENRLVEALACRFQEPNAVQPTAYDRWDDDYAAEMRRVYHRFPNDHDVMALFVEALITRTPRRLWNVRTGAPAKNSDVVEAVQVCDRSIQLNTQAGLAQHPAIVHLHIHALEMSNTPELAMASADALAAMCPDAGHLNHMPGHIYVLCGQYEKARLASVRALRANDKYLAYAGPLTFYTVACCHDLHLMMHTSMLMGRYTDAIATANKMCSLLTRDVLSVKDRPKFTMSLEGYYSTKVHVWMRFGRWNDILSAPLPDDPELYLVSTAMHHYAKGVAHGTLKNFKEADNERRLFSDSLSRIPRSRRFFNNMAHDILAVGEKMLDGELEYHRGNHQAAYQHLRDCVRLDDNLEYIEPWAWMHPPRHALAALLLEQGHAEEAEQIYRDDLGLSGKIQRCAQHPDNVWSLHGLVECLQRRGETKEMPNLQRKLAAAQLMADVPITSSCLCRTNVAPASSCCASGSG